MHRVVSCSEAATTSWPVIKSIHHLLKASPITHIGFVTNLVQGLTVEIVYHVKYPLMCAERRCNSWKHSHRKYTACRPGVPCSLQCSLPLFLPHTPVLTAPADCSVCFRPLCVCYCWGSSWSVALNEAARHRCGKNSKQESARAHTHTHTHTHTKTHNEAVF